MTTLIVLLSCAIYAVTAGAALAAHDANIWWLAGIFHTVGWWIAITAGIYLGKRQR